MALLVGLVQSFRLGELTLFVASVALQARVCGGQQSSAAGAAARAKRRARRGDADAAPEAAPTAAPVPQEAPAPPAEAPAGPGAAAAPAATPQTQQPAAPQPQQPAPPLAAAAAVASAVAATAAPAAVGLAHAVGNATSHPALGAASAALMGVHLLLEGARWQLLPLYCATGACAARLRLAARSGGSATSGHEFSALRCAGFVRCCGARPARAAAPRVALQSGCVLPPLMPPLRLTAASLPQAWPLLSSVRWPALRCRCASPLPARACSPRPPPRSPRWPSRGSGCRRRAGRTPSAASRACWSTPPAARGSRPTRARRDACSLTSGTPRLGAPQDAAGAARTWIRCSLQLWQPPSSDRTSGSSVRAHVMHRLRPACAC
jgi:hypothetical protein